MPGRANISMGRLVPVEAGRTDGFLDYFFPPDVDPDWIAGYMDFDDRVGAQDRELVESVQRLLRSGALEHGRLMLPSEELIGHFQRWSPSGSRRPLGHAAQRFGCQSAISPAAGVATTLRQPAGPSRGSSSTAAPDARAPSVAAVMFATST